MIPGSLASTTIRKTRGGYTIDQSIRFNDNDTAYMTRTPSSAGSLTTWTASFWFKRSSVSDTQVLFGAATSAINEIRFDSAANTIYYDFSNLGVYPESTLVLRDPSAWYNLVTVFDTTHATASERLRCFLNGERVTLSTTLALNANSQWNSNVLHTIGISSFSVPNYSPFDGYMAEIHFIDGQALDATSFGETNSAGVWVPIAYTGSYGTNGFYITGETASDLGEDFSGNNNDFTSSGLATTDQMLDTPTLNYPTLNSDVLYQAGLLLSDGNLDAFGSSGSNWNLIPATMQIPPTGKWAFECTILSSTGFIMIGFASAEDINNFQGSGKYFSLMQNAGWLYNTETNKKVDGTSTNSPGLAGLTTNDVVECMIDNDAGTMTFLKNGSAYASLSGLNPLTQPAIAVYTNGVYRAKVDFGQIDYVPSDSSYSAINSSTLPTPSITDGSAHFQTTVYTGNGTAIGSGGLEVNQSENSTFQPDFVWIKNRTTGGNEHDLYDAVRGATKVLFSSTTGAEATVSEGLASFDTDGFTVGNRGEVNTSGNSMVAWQWKANGAGSSNTDGTISSTVSADTTSGFSIVSYAGNLSTTGSATVGHGLGIAPSVVISKSLDSTAGDSGAWAVQHTSLAASNILRLNTTDATSDKSGNGTLSSPTSTVFYTNYTEGLNVTGNDYIAYCFAEIPGYSSIGSYTGNGSANGPFVYTGFKPAFVMFKVSSNSPTGWAIIDNRRSNPFNPTDGLLQPDQSNAEGTGDDWDILSNGFKVRTTWPAVNGNGYTVTYMAFAEHPFGGDVVAPATAR